MSALPHFGGLARRTALPRRTVRLRLTALYGTLFLASGAGLLIITNILARSWPWPRPVIVTPVGSTGRVCEVTKPVCYSPAELLAQAAAGHAAELNQLLAESAIALGAMAVVSAVLGWLVAGRVLRPLRAMTAAGSAAGTGLGLSIADAIAAAHGGTLRLYARPEGGLLAVLDLPAAGRTGPPAQLAAAGGAR